jgi:transposase
MPDQPGLRVLLERLDLLGRRVLQVRKGLKELLEPQALKAFRDHKVQLVRQEQRVLRELRALRGLLEQLALRGSVSPPPE